MWWERASMDNMISFENVPGNDQLYQVYPGNLQETQDKTRRVLPIGMDFTPATQWTVEGPNYCPRHLHNYRAFSPAKDSIEIVNCSGRGRSQRKSSLMTNASPASSWHADWSFKMIQRCVKNESFAPKSYGITVSGACSASPHKKPRGSSHFYWFY